MLWRVPWLRRRLALMSLAAWDVACVYLSYNLTYLRRLGQWEGWNLGLVVIATTWLGVSYLVGRYSPSPNKDDVIHADHIGKTLLAGIAVIGVFIGHSWFYQVTDAETRFRGFLIPLILGTCLLSIAGQASNSILSRRPRSWVVLGDTTERKTISTELMSEATVLRNRTTIASSTQVAEAVSAKGGYMTGIAIGKIEGMTDIVTTKLLHLREKGEAVIPLVSWCELELQRIPPELIRSEWLIQAEGFGLRPGSISWRIKRFGDVIGAAILIVATAPLVALAGLAIWLEDGGPVVYSQVRSGLYGRQIRIWKLRSMKVNAEKGVAMWAQKSDPRVTRVGKVIRATRIDELPQLVSVLVGDLSLIGPRPERPEIEEELVELIPNYRIRHWIRPGLSGWAQVCYPYGASIEDSRMKLSYDLYYLRNASVFLDVLITMKTVRLVVGAKGASPKT